MAGKIEIDAALAKKHEIERGLSEARTLLAELSAELKPFFIARKPITEMLTNLRWSRDGHVQQRRAALFYQLDALQFDCRHCGTPHQCENRKIGECRSVGQQMIRRREAERLEKAYKNELETLDRAIAKAEG